MTDNTLKPCPFCGSNDISDAHRFVSCLSCAADGPFSKRYANGSSIELWNRRAALSAAPDAQLEQDRLDESECDYQTIMALSRILAEISLTVKGDEKNLHRHSYHDLAKEVAICVLERDLLREQVEQDRLDAERFRYLEKLARPSDYSISSGKWNIRGIEAFDYDFGRKINHGTFAGAVDAAIAQAKEAR